MPEINYDWKNSVCVVKGISSKSGKPYEVLSIKKQDRWNNILINLAKADGVEVFDTTPKVTEE